MTNEGAEVFDVPPALRGRVEEIRNKYRLALAMQMAEEMVDAGLDTHLAMHIAVLELRVSAARMAMLACELEKRAPRRDLWLRRAEEDFDEAADWFAQLKAKGDGDDLIKEDEA